MQSLLNLTTLQNYYGNGKLLLSGEYYVLDGAQALALPTNLGQRLKVSYFPSEHKVLHWKSYDNDGQIWFEARFDIETFECLDRYMSQKSLILQKILRMARKMAANFLRGREYVLVETHLEFPRLWGLGSSSTLIYNVAKWAGVNPFDLQFTTLGGSGYDVACAQSNGPIIYEKSKDGPMAHTVEFNPPFKDQLYFVYLGKKQDSRQGIDYYRSLDSNPKTELIGQLSQITHELLKATTLEQFNQLIKKHEQVIAESLKMTRVKELYFDNYWGEVKSLGAWGGDFVLVTSDRDREQTRQYFSSRGFEVFIPYCEMIREAF